MSRALVVLCLALAAAHGGESVSAASHVAIADAAEHGDDFATIMPSLDDAERLEALALIGGRHVASAVPAVAACLAAKRADVRLAAMRALTSLPVRDPAARAQARAALGDGDPAVRGAAIAYAVANQDRLAMPGIADALGDGGNAEAAHAALVKLAGGIDLGRSPDDWKRWHEEHEAREAEMVASLRDRLASGDRATVLAALPDVAVIDLDQDQKKRLIEPLRGDRDATVAAAAESVWSTVAGVPRVDPATVVVAPPPAVRAAAPATTAAAPRRLARGDVVLFAACATAVAVGIGLFVFLVRSGRSITRHFTRVISVQLRKKGGARSEPSSALQAATKADSGRLATSRTATSVRTEAIKPKSDRTAVAQASGQRSGAAKVISDRVTAARPGGERSGAAKVVSDRIEAAKASSDRTAAVRAVSERISAVKSADAAKPTSERVPAVPTSPDKP